jgi:hypothetical protein
MNKDRKVNLMRLALAMLLVAGLAVAAYPQLRQVIKAVGVTLAVRQFSGEMNKGMNRLLGWNDTSAVKTKVVPILSVGINSRNAIGAAQVIGPAAAVDQVQAVAQVEGDFLGREVRLRGLVPVASDKDLSNPKRVAGVGVSGIVDLKL